MTPLEISVPDGNGNTPGYSVQRSSTGLGVSVGAITDGPAMFGVTNDRAGVGVNVWPVGKPPVGAPGWHVFIYRDSGRFTLNQGVTIEADVLLVGGGGAGGGGIEGGGGGGGGVLDLHGITIKARQTDGAITVGHGGDEVAVGAVAADENLGRSTTFGGHEAFGGGYGSAEIEAWNGAPYAYYHASDGASGGGGGPWGNAAGPPNHGPGGKSIHTSQGHDGSYGWSASSGGYVFSGGGGGGAGMHGGDQTDGPWYTDQEGYLVGHSPQSGGVGAPCDIAGYGPLWVLTDHLFRFIPWFGGGGAGCAREGSPYNEHSTPGYGGGGAAGAQGDLNTGGGGGGSSMYQGPGGGTPADYNAPGPAGGRGLCIIRIATADLGAVDYPQPSYWTYEYNAITDVYENVPHYPDGILVTHLDESQPHTDEPGDEDRPHTWEENH